MIFHLIRHGQSRNNALPSSQRVHDPAITELGQIQAGRVAEHLQSVPLTLLVASPFRRALQTAWHTVESKSDVAAELWIDTHEAGGCYRGHLPNEKVGEPGMRRSEIAKQYPGIQLPNELTEQGWWNSKPYETKPQSLKRTERFIEMLRSRNWADTDQVAFFSHADFISFFAEVAHPRILNQEVYNGSISSYRFEDGKFEIVGLNQVGHLTSEELTT